ncbi:MAG TPA: YetF domain-containing protein [Anaerolineales bacterium]
MELDLTGIIIRVSVMYVYALALVRISGKQTLGQLTPMDFIVTLVIGDFFDDIFWAEVPVLQGMVAFAIIVLLHMLVTFITSRNKSIYWALASPARPLVEDGRLVQKSLQLERMRPESLQSDLRLKGEEHLREIKEARLEPSGQVSVIKQPDNKPVQKKDERLLR